jgi:hypothetical protein
MAKSRKENASLQRNKKPRVWQAIFAVVVLAAIISAYLLRGRGSSSGDTTDISDAVSTDPLLRDRLVLPARPQNPRPVTLDPNNFSDSEVRAAYQAAKDVPEVLEHVACYCGCFGEAGHRNNLDCYHDNHGVT